MTPRLSPTPRLRTLARIALWLCVAVAVAMALTPHPPALPLDAYGDKTEHGFAFFWITLFAGIGYKRVPMWLLAEHLSFLGALIEVGQSLPALGRDCDIRDWIADTVMVVAVLAGLALVRRLRDGPAPA